MPHHAVTIAMPPRPPKKLKTRISPSAEFWIPTSIATARRSRSGSPATRAAAQPLAIAVALCNRTAKTTKPTQSTK